MLRSCRIALVALSLAVMGRTSIAEIGTLDVVPAATLLVPYFEVDLEDQFPSTNTILTIQNAGPVATIAHVMLFTDLGVGTVAFDVYLTGYDLERINLRDLIRDNSLNLPEDTPVDGTPVPLPTEDALFADGFESGDLTGWTTYTSDVALGTVQAYHTGGPAYRTGLCGGFNHGDGLARGYVLIDAVSQTGANFPNTPGYFVTGGNGIATNDNILTGRYELLDEGNNFAYGNPMIHIEASGTGPTATPGEYTFYCRYTGVTAADNREPAATDWAARYIDGGVFNGGAEIIYWRGLKVAQFAFSCDAQPSWYPMTQPAILMFDEEENPTFNNVSTVFPLACGRLRVGEDIATPFVFGWMTISLDTQSAGPIFGTIQQGVITTTTNAAGRFNAGNMALPLNNALDLLP